MKRAMIVALVFSIIPLPLYAQSDETCIAYMEADSVYKSSNAAAERVYHQSIQGIIKSYENAKRKYADSERQIRIRYNTASNLARKTYETQIEQAKKIDQDTQNTNIKNGNTIYWKIRREYDSDVKRTMAYSKAEWTKLNREYKNAQITADRKAIADRKALDRWYSKNGNTKGSFTTYNRKIVKIRNILGNSLRSVREKYQSLGQNLRKKIKEMDKNRKKKRKLAEQKNRERAKAALDIRQKRYATAKKAANDEYQKFIKIANSKYNSQMRIAKSELKSAEKNYLNAIAPFKSALKEKQQKNTLVRLRTYLTAYKGPRSKNTEVMLKILAADRRRCQSGTEKAPTSRQADTNKMPASQQDAACQQAKQACSGIIHGCRVNANLWQRQAESCRRLSRNYNSRFRSDQFRMRNCIQTRNNATRLCNSAYSCLCNNGCRRFC